MIVVRRPWRDIPVPALVIDPAGRIWLLAGKHNGNHGPFVELSDPTDGSTGVTMSVDPSAAVDTITTDLPLERAVDILAGRFALERI